MALIEGTHSLLRGATMSQLLWVSLASIHDYVFPPCLPEEGKKNLIVLAVILVVTVLAFPAGSSLDSPRKEAKTSSASSSSDSPSKEVTAPAADSDPPSKEAEAPSADPDLDSPSKESEISPAVSGSGHPSKKVKITIILMLLVIQSRAYEYQCGKEDLPVPRTLAKHLFWFLAILVTVYFVLEKGTKLRALFLYAVFSGIGKIATGRLSWVKELALAFAEEYKTQIVGESYNEMKANAQRFEEKCKELERERDSLVNERLKRMNRHSTTLKGKDLAIAAANSERIESVTAANKERVESVNAANKERIQLTKKCDAAVDAASKWAENYRAAKDEQTKLYLELMAIKEQHEAELKDLKEQHEAELKDLKEKLSKKSLIHRAGSRINHGKKEANNECSSDSSVVKK